MDPDTIAFTNVCVAGRQEGVERAHGVRGRRPARPRLVVPRGDQGADAGLPSDVLHEAADAEGGGGEGQVPGLAHDQRARVAVAVAVGQPQPDMDRNRRAVLVEADAAAEERAHRALEAGREEVAALQEELPLLREEHREAGEVHDLAVGVGLREVGVDREVEDGAGADRPLEVAAHLGVPVVDRALPLAAPPRTAAGARWWKAAAVRGRRAGRRSSSGTGCTRAARATIPSSRSGAGSRERS